MEFLGMPELPNDGLISSAAAQQFSHVTSSSSSPLAMALLHPAMSRDDAPYEELYRDGGLNRATPCRAGEDDSATPSTSPSRSLSPSPPPHRSLLDKPLEQLTEEDIMHLTREDCRRYLKQKGMRRPSWNKSQAIQQVLSLKGLFDSKDDEEKSFWSLTCPKKLNKESSFIQEVPEQARGASCTSQRETAAVSKQSSLVIIAGNEVCVNSGKASHRQERQDMYASCRPCDSQLKRPQTKVSTVINTLSKSSSAYMCPTGQVPATPLQLKESHFFSQKKCSQCTEGSGFPGAEQSSQLTIFYSGMVNVYDNVPEDKARAVMSLAERSNNTLKPSLCSQIQNLTNAPVIAQSFNSSCRPMPYYVHSTVATTEVSSTVAPPTVSVPIAQTINSTQSEHQPSRKACLQRYLEKRRGRYGVRSPYATPMKRAVSDGFSSQLMSERYNLNNFIEMVGPSMALHRNLNQVQLPTQSSSGSETSSSHLQSCSSS